MLRNEGPYRVAIAGASTLRGKELKQVLEDRNFPSSDYILLDESIAAGTLTEAGGEPTFIRPLDAESFEGAQFVFFAGSADEAAKNWAAAHRSGATIIDLTGGTARDHARFSWIPSLSRLLPPHDHNSPRDSQREAVYLSPPAAVLIGCTLAATLQPFSPSRIVILFFPPVSEQDQPGVDELENQTANLLSFRPVAQPVFDSQVAFNLLSSYGNAAAGNLSRMRSLIADGIRDYLAGRMAAPAIQLIQAPVFYGYAFAAYAEFPSPQVPETIEAALLGASVQIMPDEPPNNVTVAGQELIQVARVLRDSNVAAGVWISGAADNLRLTAYNAVRIAEELLVTPV